MRLSATSPTKAKLARSFRIFILVLSIAATLNISLASTSPAHLHLNSSSPNRCDLCFTAHATTFETPAAAPLCVPETEGRTAPVIAFFSYRPFLSQHRLTRGPPSLFV